MKSAEQISTKVAHYRADRGLSLDETCTILTALGSRWDRTRLVAIEQGRRSTITVDELYELAAALDVDVDSLLPRGEAEFVTADAAEAAARGDHWAIVVGAQLGASPAKVHGLALRLYGRSVTDERSSRVENAGAELDPYATRTISRQLRQEIRDRL